MSRVPWAVGTEKPRGRSNLAARAERVVPRVTRLARAEFRAERAAVLEGAAAVIDAGSILRVVDDVHEAMGEAWMRWFRRVYVTVGQLFARDGVPPGEARAKDEPGVGIAWGPLSDPWWFNEFRPGLGDEAWWDAWLESTVRYAERVGSRRIRHIDGTTRRLVQREIRAGVDAGEGIDRVIRRIDRLYLEQIIPHRSEVIARTETLTAARAGSFEATRAQGLAGKVLKSWLPVGDDRTRAEHLEAGSTNVDVPFEEPFIVRNPATGAPERLLFPGDASLGAGPANIIQCRCDMVRRLP